MVDNSLLVLQSADKLERQPQRRTWPFQTNATTTLVQGVTVLCALFLLYICLLGLGGTPPAAFLV